MLNQQIKNMSEKVKPLKGISLKENRVLIKTFSAEEKTAAGIILPEGAQEAPPGGLVVSIGPGKVDPTTGVLVPNVCKVGEKVRYMAHGMEVEIGEETYYLLRDSDVWGDIS